MIVAEDGSALAGVRGRGRFGRSLLADGVRISSGAPRYTTARQRGP
jgi:hypothetical protein